MSPFDGSCCGGNSSYNDLSSGDSSMAEDVPKYRVVLLGESGVGKTALVSQFMTSEYMNTYDASLGEFPGTCVVCGGDTPVFGHIFWKGYRELFSLING